MNIINRQDKNSGKHRVLGDGPKWSLNLYFIQKVLGIDPKWSLDLNFIQFPYKNEDSDASGFREEYIARYTMQMHVHSTGPSTERLDRLTYHVLHIVHHDWVLLGLHLYVQQADDWPHRQALTAK